MNIGDHFLVSPTPLKGIYKDSIKIHDLFLDVKMGIFIFGQTQKIDSCKTGSQFTQIINDI